jgi:hypothetical protein
MAKKQFKKEVELNEEQIFENEEEVLEKEQIERIKQNKKERIFSKPIYRKEKESFKNHRDWLCYFYKLDKNKNIGIDTKELIVKNIDYSDIINNRTTTIPLYIESLFGVGSWDNFINYDAVINSNNTELKNYLLEF